MFFLTVLQNRINIIRIRIPAQQLAKSEADPTYYIP